MDDSGLAFLTHALIATFRYDVKRGLAFFATFRYTFAGMAETFSDLLRARLDAKGWTREQFAKAAGVSASGLRKLERGGVTDARGPTVAKLAAALGLKPERVRKAIVASARAAE